ncbi:protein-tyrosine kinase [Ruminococcus sp. CLA-AA-H200]|uniref:Protein-tyrosine kinase n=1 Tax=Ruminococcus turbiniformis TaxID=2881258 RepID=A0ABS8G2P8_9FIRM|nr:Wzz/FepE/Etk N-terminal domain-containing protein [Ruminococcus turbiniformis]MCC2255209.1 protein-tyrosine kinase [Ruminococcus turbiniformis]
MNQDRAAHDFDNDEITIDLTELLSFLWGKAYIIILAGIVAALVAFGGTQLLITPKYTSSTSMYMLTRSDGNSGLTTSDLQTGTQLTQDYMELVKSRTVLEQVISVLNLDMTPEELSSTITTSNTENTRILTIQVENEDPELAREIADAVREAASVTIEDIMEIDAVNTIEMANLPENPSSPSVMRNTAIGGLLGIVLAAGILVLIFILDDTIKTPDDVENYLGLNVLTSIPIQEGEQKVKKTKRRTTRKMARKMKR